MHRSETGTAPGLSEGSWRKSTYSNPSGNCVEVALVEGAGVAVRNSREPHGPVLTYTTAEITAFVLGVKAGEFDDLIGEGAQVR
jgi:hypothetical protein